MGSFITRKEQIIVVSILILLTLVTLLSGTTLTGFVVLNEIEDTSLGLDLISQEDKNDSLVEIKYNELSITREYYYEADKTYVKDTLTFNKNLKGFRYVLDIPKDFAKTSSELEIQNFTYSILKEDLIVSIPIGDVVKDEIVEITYGVKDIIEKEDMNDIILSIKEFSFDDSNEITQKRVVSFAFVGILFLIITLIIIIMISYLIFNKYKEHKSEVKEDFSKMKFEEESGDKKSSPQYIAYSQDNIFENKATSHDNVNSEQKALEIKRMINFLKGKGYSNEETVSILVDYGFLKEEIEKYMKEN